MVDIAMCDNDKCLVKDTCFRYRATPSQYQTYFIVAKEEKDATTCSEYWEVTSEENLEKLNRYWAD